MALAATGIGVHALYAFTERLAGHPGPGRQTTPTVRAQRPQVNPGRERGVPLSPVPVVHEE
ncbi:hypothetical protein [Streptomyces sp. CRN 30]|uniref:hypothetical protein n=1 Tax=Streptomyces sp. CRN 30 TaxID=3075613 RepID=UPI002A8170B0|nr:hypothetical protein [Streptomyces sp. CRN 30]